MRAASSRWQAGEGGGGAGAAGAVGADAGQQQSAGHGEEGDGQRALRLSHAVRALESEKAELVQQVRQRAHPRARARA